MSVIDSVSHGDGVFKSFGPKDWLEYYDSLNSETPVEDVRLKLSDEEKKAYEKALGVLKKERERIPGVCYEIKYTWIE